MAPVRYAATDIYPRNQGTETVGLDEGWLAYELRDIQRFGPPVNGAPQPNTEAFGTAHPGRYCNDAGFPCFSNDTAASLTLKVPTPAPGLQLSRARVLADLKRGFSSTESPISVVLQGEGMIGSFEPAIDSPAVEPSSWVRRGIEAPVSGLPAGSDRSLNFSLGEGSYLDRIEVEFSYESEVGGTIFSDGFESGNLSNWSACAGPGC